MARKRVLLPEPDGSLTGTPQTGSI
jgi:hypothetical protein